MKVEVLAAQSCLTLCDPMDCSPPGCSVHGILQARILEWVAISSPWDFPNRGIRPMSPKSPAFSGRFSKSSISFARARKDCVH